jgi:hypothetical protein
MLFCVSSKTVKENSSIIANGRTLPAMARLLLPVLFFIREGLTGASKKM